jgi:predicted amidohydrolase
MSKFLALGLSLDEVVSRATLAPARALGLTVDADDVTVLELVDAPVEWEDTWGHTFAGTRRLRVVHDD